VIPSAQAQAFCAALRAAGAATVCYAELPNAHHAFDTVATVRSRLVADAVADFLGVVYGRYARARTGWSPMRVQRPGRTATRRISNSA
jgi:hypothetical protein